MRTAVLAVRLGELAGSPRRTCPTLLRCAPARLRLHLERPRSGAALRRRHRAPGRLLPRDPTNPAEVLDFYRANVGLGRPEEVRAKISRWRSSRPRPEHARPSRRCARSRSASPAGSGCALRSRRARVRLLAVGRPRVPGRRGRGDAAADPPPARGQGHLAVPHRRGSQRGTRRPRAPVGRGLRPRLVNLATDNLDELLAEIEDAHSGSSRFDVEPTPQIWLSGRADRRRLRDHRRDHRIEVPWLREHCTAWPSSRRPRAWRMELPAETITALRHAAIVHDLGRVGVSKRHLGRSRARLASATGSACGARALHERAFAHRRRSPRSGAWQAHTTSASTGPATTAAHGPALDQAARILAAADCYVAMREERPYRPALDAERRRSSCCSRPRRGVSTPRSSTRCWRPAGTASPRRVRELPRGSRRASSRCRLALARGQSNRRSPTYWASPPRPSATTCSTFTRRRACAPRGGDALGLRAGPRSRGIGRSPMARQARPQIVAAPSASISRCREPQRRIEMNPGHHDDRGLSSASRDLSRPRRRQAPRSTAPRRSGLPRSQRGGPRLGPLRLGRGWLASFVSDPSVPPIMQEPGTRAAQTAAPGGSYDA